MATIQGLQVFRGLAALAVVTHHAVVSIDSKNLLKMPGRQRPGFRLFFFLMPLAGALVLWPYESATGFLVLVGYYALVAALGTAANMWPLRTGSKQA